MARIVQPTPEAIAEAAAIIRDGGMVAFPTETVYGLGANALDTDAVAQLFVAKGRPSTNPIIVHVGSVDDARHVADFSPLAEELAAQYWPGPLSMVLPKREIVPDIVTAGGPTVGLRMPRHPVALAMLAACGLPIAAPSANRSEELSPTLAQHVADSLGDAVDMILDGGPCEVGIESTVVLVGDDGPVVLRRGMIGEDGYGWEFLEHDRAGSPLQSPGRHLRHYAPKTPLVLVDSESFWVKAQVAGSAIPLLGYTPPGAVDTAGRVVVMMPTDAKRYAAKLYAALHELDEAAQLGGAPYILAEAPPRAGLGWNAIRDRLTRASAKK